MSQLTFKSPGVSTREIDLSQPTTRQPSGVPAGVIGTARRGPAFVPVTVATFQDFVAKFGNTDGEAFGPLAMNEWLRNASAGTYVRLLGIGDGKMRTKTGTNAGKVNNAGFVVGDRQVQADGFVGNNPYATVDRLPGRAYVLGAFMSESAGSTIFSDAGLQVPGEEKARPIIRGILFAASGVQLTLSSSRNIPAGHDPNITPTNAIGGESFGDVLIGSGDRSDFVLLLNGLVPSDQYTNVITASFDPKSPNSFAKIFNTDPTKIEEAGHYLYSHFDIQKELAVITGSGLTDVDDDLYLGRKIRTAFVLSSSMLLPNVGDEGSANYIGVPNFEGFEDRFRTAFSPWIISQQLGGDPKEIFRAHALDDGQAGSDTFKITIENIQASTNQNNLYGSFDLLVRRFDDSDLNPIVLESFRGVNLDPTSDRFVLRVVGDTHVYYDLDKREGGQKLVIDGVYPNRSQYIRLEGSEQLLDGSLEREALPMGFRGLYHLATSGSATDGVLNNIPVLTGSYSSAAYGGGAAAQLMLKSIVQPPVPFRRNIRTGQAPKVSVVPSLTWGVQFEINDSVTEPNANQSLDPSIRSFVRYMPHHLTTTQNLWVGDNEGVSDVGGSILDADRFNNNLFTLERVVVIDNSTDVAIKMKPDSMEWGSAVYARNGVLPDELTDRFGDSTVPYDGGSLPFHRFVMPSDFAHLPSRRYLKFTFPLQGGFDGVNIFNADKSKFHNNAVLREFDDEPNQGGADGPTIAAYRKAIQVMEEKSDVDIKLLAIPGVRHQTVTDFAIDAVERRFDALYLMDVDERDQLAMPITSSEAVISVGQTAIAHASKNYDTSFAAAYFPDVVITDPATRTNVQCPPSVAVLGAMAYNDAVAHPWFAPAGFNRGALSTVVETQVKLNRANLDDLYEVDINPITSFPSTPGVVVYGQKTLLATESALDRVNVRRLLIELRRQVKAVANTLLFEPNREELLARFRNAVTPILNRIQAQQGVDRFKVQIDTTTTTQADVENNTIRGRIYVQPTRSVEFVSLDFAVTNAGANI
jgi:phage tail sheath protein FI